MGFFFSYGFYAFYAAATIIVLISYLLRRYDLFLFLFFVLFHINVTSFSNAGIAWTGNYIVIFSVILFEIILSFLKGKPLPLAVFKRQKVWFFLFFLFFISLISVVVRRVGLIDMPTPYDGLDFILRSSKSFIRYFIILIGFLIISNKIHKSHRIQFYDIVKYLSLSSILPIFVVYFQTIFITSPMFLLHNNKTFRKEAQLVEYVGQRAVGLSDEASYFAYLISFSFIATLWLSRHSKTTLKRVFYVCLMVFQISAVSFSLSRTGLVLMFSSSLFFAWYESPKYMLKFVIFVTPAIIGLNFVSELIGLEYSLFERVFSIINVSEDLSNIQRYGTFVALFKMLFTQEAIFGYGFFNYMFYMNNFFPEFMSVFLKSTSSIEFYPSFSLILQLIIESGWGLSLLFLIYINKDRFLKKSVILNKNKRSQLAFHYTVCFLIVLSAFSFNIFTFSMTFLPVLYACKLSSKGFNNGWYSYRYV